MKRGRFITLEGGEGVGKSTNLEYLRALLVARGFEVVVTREPGGVPLAEQLREFILGHQGLLPEAELLLMFSARVHHVREKIRPALERGQWVISDRFVDASYAYQGGGRGIDRSHITCLEQWLLADCRPDLTLLFDAPVETGLSRARERGESNRFEEEAVEFQQRVRQAYLERWREEPGRIRRIDAALPLPQVQEQITRLLDEALATWNL